MPLELTVFVFVKQQNLIAAHLVKMLSIALKMENAKRVENAHAKLPGLERLATVRILTHCLF